MVTNGLCHNLLHPAVAFLAAELEVAEPEVEVTLEPDGDHPVDVEDAEDRGDVGDGLGPLLLLAHLPLLAAVALGGAAGGGVGHGAYDGALAQVAERVDAEQVGDVVEEVLLARGVAAEAELEVAAAAHDLGELGAGEEAPALEVVELVGHLLEAVLYRVPHLGAGAVEPLLLLGFRVFSCGGQDGREGRGESRHGNEEGREKSV